MRWLPRPGTDRDVDGGGPWGLAMGLYAMTTDPVLPPMKECGAGDEPRTRDLRLGKPALYQLSYARTGRIVRWFWVP